MEVVTYHLNPLQKNASFYEELSVFTSDFLARRSLAVIRDVENFRKYLTDKQHPITRTFDEHFLEYLTLGVVLNKYIANALASGRISNSILISLYKNRNKVALFKPLLDRLRGVLATIFLTRTNKKVEVVNAAHLKRLLMWMDATGEYSEETIRLNYWHQFISSLPLTEQIYILENSRSIATDFEYLSRKRLGVYTSNLDAYKEKQLPGRLFKEDFIFCNKQEVEYHLNMVGAEILNRALRENFAKTQQKVILFPTCMSKPADGKCRAFLFDKKLRCTGCSPECNINKVKKEYVGKNTEVVLIPHSSGFTKYLAYWKDQNRTGLVGVACVLNLLKGGYEMQKLNIPSQCVFLDYCGCKKHWHKKGLPTNINRNQLNLIMNPHLN